MYETIVRLIHLADLSYLGALAAAGVIGFVDSWKTVRGTDRDRGN
jgi:hypothetical protein